MMLNDAVGNRDPMSNEVYPKSCTDLVRRVHAQGHEIATHGYAHQLVSEQTAEEFSQDIEQSLHVLEDITGEKVLGY